MCIFGVYATFSVFGVPLYLMYVLDRLCLKVFLSNMCVPTTSLRDAKSLYFREGNVASSTLREASGALRAQAAEEGLSRRAMLWFRTRYVTPR